MIAQYEAEGRDVLLDAPRQYGLSQKHKHLPEMAEVCGLKKAPVFCPVVAPYYAGMEVTVMLSADGAASFSKILNYLKGYYSGGVIHFSEGDTFNEGGFISAGAFSGRDDLEISVYGNDERVLLVSRFDNLGKGASGAAIQNMNILLGVEETTGLKV